MAIDKTRKKGLGRGLSALLGDDQSPTEVPELDKVRSFKTVPVEFLHPGRYQPRHAVDPESLADLAESIRTKGILQPILVRRDPDEANSFEIIAGERRWQAAQMAQLHEVPVVVRDLSDQEALEIALVENLQRQDLSALEEAEGYRRLMDEFSHTQEMLAQAVGKSRSHVANMMRLLNLPGTIKEFLARGELSAGHARALLNAPEPEVLARHVVERGLNVRQTEKLAQQKPKATQPRKTRAERDPDTDALERDVSNMLGLKVEIRYRGRGGELVLHYGSLEQLDDLLSRLSHGVHASPMPPVGFAPGEEPLDDDDLARLELDLPDAEAEPEALTADDSGGEPSDFDLDLDVEDGDEDEEQTPEEDTAPTGETDDLDLDLAEDDDTSVDDEELAEFDMDEDPLAALERRLGAVGIDTAE